MYKKVNVNGRIVEFPAEMSYEQIADTIIKTKDQLGFGDINPGDDEPEGFSGLMKNFVTGAKQTGRMVEATGKTYLGDLSGVESVSKESNLARENDTPLEQRKLQDELSRINKDQGALGQIGDTLSAAWDNKIGTAQMVAEQAPNSLVSLGSGWAGAKAGALAGGLLGPVGAAVGGTIGFLGGMFLGNTLLETGGKAIEKAGDGFTKQEAEDSIIEGAKKSLVVTGVDAATLKLGGAITQRFGKASINAGARAEAKVLMDAGVDMSSAATINAALKSSPELFQTARLAGEKAATSALSRTNKIGALGTGMALETLGEGVGEYAGEDFATGKGDVVDATIEALSSATQSSIETAYNYNKMKLGNEMNVTNIQSQFGTIQSKKDQAEQTASSINDTNLQQDVDNIQSAQSVDEAIQKTSEVVSKNPVNTDDILRTVDPTLADLERVSGLKPTEILQNELDQATRDLNELSIQSQQLDQNNLTGATIERQDLSNTYVNLKLFDKSGNEVVWNGAEDKHPGRVNAQEAIQSVDNRIDLINKLRLCLG